ncbi:MAG: serine hydrolase [Verrucomicrobiota bacterium]
MNPQAIILVGFLLTVAGLAHSAPFKQATPESEGVSSDQLRAMSEWIRSEELDVRSLIILRNGKLILEWYAGEVTPEMNHNVFSVTKSFVSTVAGIAITERRLSSLESAVGDALDLPDPLGQINLDQLLTMRSGLPQSRANKPTGPERELFDRITAAQNRLGEIASLDLVTEPGSKFAYSNIDPQLVSAMIKSGYGSSILEVAEEKLFQPLSFEGARWFYADETGLYPGGYGLRLRPLDMAKLGQLYLDGGKWDGKPILPASWVLDSTVDQTGNKYGYYWWTGIVGGKSFAAKGVRGQQILVVPEKKLVFVVTADLPPDRVRSILGELNRNHLLKAIASDGSLPEDPAARAALEDELSKAAIYLPSHRRGLPKARLPRMPLGRGK